MTTGTLILNVALMVAVTFLMTAVMVAVPNIDRLQVWRQRARAQRTARTAVRRERQVRGALPTAS